MHDDLLNGKFNKVPVMMGITSEEILRKLIYKYSDLDSILNILCYLSMLSNDILYYGTTMEASRTVCKFISHKTRRFYNLTFVMYCVTRYLIYYYYT